jgi:hypothetical protein
MQNKNQAAIWGVVGLGALFSLMVVYYFVSHRMNTGEGELEGGGFLSEVQSKGEKSEFVGVYSPTGQSLEGSNRRLTQFMVNRSEDGGYLGSVRLDSVGSIEPAKDLPCNDVRIDEKEFFLKCGSEADGSVSISGQWSKGVEYPIQVNGKALWTLGGQALIEGDRVFNKVSE